MKNDLTTTEETELATLEAIIEKGLETYVEVGRSLMKIRDRKLYRGVCSSFEKYCELRWHFKRERARQLMSGAKIFEELSWQSVNHGSHSSNNPQPKVLPDAERQVRPLADLPTSTERSAAWNEAVDTAPKGRNGRPRVTGAHVERVVAARVERSAPAAETSVEPTDLVGNVLPNIKRLRSIFADRHLITEAQSALTAFAKLKVRMWTSDSPAVEAIKGVQVQIDGLHEQIRVKLRLFQFHSICPDCRGKGCSACQNMGAITRDEWNRKSRVGELLKEKA